MKSPVELNSLSENCFISPGLMRDETGSTLAIEGSTLAIKNQNDVMTYFTPFHIFLQNIFHTIFELFLLLPLNK